MTRASAFRNHATVCIFLCLVFVTAAAGLGVLQPATEQQALYEGHHWFQLRDVIKKTQAPELYRGAVASAFNQVEETENVLQGIIVNLPSSGDAAEAREVLNHLYMRAGNYSRAVQNMKQQMAAGSGRSVSNDEQAMFAVLAQLTDQSVSSRSPSTLKYEMRGASLSVPLSINEKPAHFLLDSDSNISVISESEANRLDMSIVQGGVSVSGVTGHSIGGARMAVAKNLIVGNFHFKNVAFLVLRDDQPPFDDFPAGKRGILGMPVILAFETFRWHHDGTVDFGFAAGKKDLSRSNLCFDNEDPITLVEFQQRKLEFVMDTGGTDSELWPPFAKDFGSLLSQSGQKDSKTLTGYTGSQDVSVVTLPELHLGLGGFMTTLKPAPVLVKSSVAPSKWYYGRASMDLLNQASTVTIDFKAMTITLENK